MTPKCPICKSEEYMKFVFVLYHQNGDTSPEQEQIENENPTDYHFLFMCPIGHIYDDENNQIIPGDENTHQNR